MAIESVSGAISIGTLATRSGVTTSTLRFYESLGLISSTRTGGNQRRYPREMLRKVAIIRAANRVGLSLSEIKSALCELPVSRMPTAADWRELASSWRHHLDARMGELQRLRDNLAECIGCGCLSLQRCNLLNTADRVARLGSGARFLMGDHAE